MPALTTPAPAPMPSPTVQTMPVAQFIATFPPMYYGGTWEDIQVDAEAGHEPQGEYDDHFLASGTSGMDFDSLVCSVQDEGVQTPVDVVGGEVEDGHHRVVAAMYAGKPVPFRVWS
jgi:hypothetical protein